MTLNIAPNDQVFFKEVDETGIYSLLANNCSWFSNDLNEDDIKSMYIPSLCSQNNTINVYVQNSPSDMIGIKVNNKAATFEEFMKIVNDMSYVKKYTINAKLYHTGLYIYPGQTMHKWTLQTMNIHSVEDNMLDDDELGDIETFWGDLVNKSDETLVERIKEYENTRVNLKTLYSQILQEKKSHKDWESKITGLKKMIQNIIF
jgi:hypothetical protein